MGFEVNNIPEYYKFLSQAFFIGAKMMLFGKVFLLELEYTVTNEVCRFHFRKESGRKGKVLPVEDNL